MAITDWLSDLKQRWGIRSRIKIRRRSRRVRPLAAEVQLLEPRQLLSVNAVNDTYVVAPSNGVFNPTNLYVLQNDTTSPGGQAISITSVSTAKNGTVEIVHAEGQSDYVKYTPSKGFLGTDSFTYTDKAADNSTATGTVTLTVDTAPTFGQSTYTYTLGDTANSSFLGSATATDSDAGQTITYNLANNSYPKSFSIDAQMGKINYLGGLPMAPQEITFQVVATDSLNVSKTANIVVNVTATNHAPTFGQSKYSFTLSDTSTSSLLGSVSATDSDPGQTVTYSLANNAYPKAFSIDPQMGKINYLGGLPMTPQEITFQVVATDPMNVSATSNVTISVTAANHAPTFGQGKYSFSLSDVSKSTLLGSVAATDSDPGQTVTYSLANNNYPKSFSIDPQMGKINYLGGLPMSPQEITFQVVATDPMNATATSNVTVSVTAANHAPTFGQGKYSFSLSDVSKSTLLGSVTATDADPGQTVTYSLANSNYPKSFSIDPQMGTINYLGGLPMSPQDIIFQVVATDPMNTTASTDVVVSVTASNHAPTFGQAKYTFNLADTTQSSMLGSVTATDSDPGQTVTYSLANNNYPKSFSIDPQMGKITYLGGLPMSPQDIIFQVVATDPMNATVSSDVIVTVTASNPAPVVSNLAYSAPNSSFVAGGANGTLTGLMTDSGPAGSTYLIEVDRGADGSIETSFAPNAGNINSSLWMPIGTTAVNVRGKETVASTGQVIYGTWQTLTVNLQYPANSAPSVSGLAWMLTNPNGSGGGYGKLSGQVNDATVVGATSYSVEIDTNGDSVADQSVSAAAMAFSSYTTLPYGETIVRFRAIETSQATGKVTTGEWASLPVTITNNPPQFGQLTLNFDTTNSTPQQPKAILAGQLTDDTSPGGYVIQIDRNADGVAEESFSITGMDFSQTILVSYGTNSLKVRAVDVSSGQSLASGWQTISLTVNPPVDAPPQVADLEFETNPPQVGSTQGTGTLTGIVTDDAATTPYTIQIDLNSDGVAEQSASINDSDFEISVVLPFGNSTLRVRAGAALVTGSMQYGNWQTLNVTLLPPNSGPVFSEANYEFPAFTNTPDETVIGTVSAIDPQGTAVQYSMEPQAGFEIDAATGEITVTDPAVLIAGESYTLEVSASDGELTATATVVVEVTYPPPQPTDDSATTPSNQPLLLDVLANDSDPENLALMVVAVSTAAHGTVEIVNNQVRYTPNSEYYGSDSFTYTMQNSGGETAVAQVSLLVQPAAPVIEELGLLIDTVLPFDGLTEDARLTGVIVADVPLAEITIEFDYDGDGLADAETGVNIAPASRFLYDVGADLGYGEHSVGVRAVVRDANGEVVNAGNWQTVEIEYVESQPLPEELLPPDPNLAVFVSVAATQVAVDRVTIAGAVTNVNGGAAPQIEFDLNFDGVADLTISPNGSGAFSRTFTNEIGYGLQLVSVRTRDATEPGGAALIGRWNYITFERAYPEIDPPEVESLELASEISGGTTVEPKFHGEVAESSTEFQYLNIEYDLDDDGFADGSATPNSNGSFEVDLSAAGLDFGAVTVKVRATAWDPNRRETISGEWTTFSFKYADPQGGSVGLTDLHLAGAVSEGSSATSDARIFATVDSTYVDFTQFRVEYDINGDGVADGSANAVDSQTREVIVDLNSEDLSSGTVVVALRTRGHRAGQFDDVIGAWQTISFDYVAPPQPLPTIADLALVNDDGVPDDLVTTDPRVQGIVREGTLPVGGLLIEWDRNGDGLADGTALSDNEGGFKLDLRSAGLAAGPVTLMIRAGRYDFDQGQIVYGDWTSFEFTRQFPAPPAPPSISGVSVLGNENGDLPIITGSLGAGAAGMVEYDLNGDDIADGTVAVDLDDSGNFTVDLSQYFSAAGSQTVRIRSVGTPNAQGVSTAGAWQSVSFNLPQPTAPTPTDQGMTDTTVPFTSAQIQHAKFYGGGLPAVAATGAIVNPWAADPSGAGFAGYGVYVVDGSLFGSLGNLSDSENLPTSGTVTNSDTAGNTWIVATNNTWTWTLVATLDVDGYWDRLETLISTYDVTTTYTGIDGSGHVMQQSGFYNYTLHAYGFLGNATAGYHSNAVYSLIETSGGIFTNQQWSSGGAANPYVISGAHNWQMESDGLRKLDDAGVLPSLQPQSNINVTGIVYDIAPYGTRLSRDYAGGGSLAHGTDRDWTWTQSSEQLDVITPSNNKTSYLDYSWLLVDHDPYNIQNKVNETVVATQPDGAVITRTTKDDSSLIGADVNTYSSAGSRITYNDQTYDSVVTNTHTLDISNVYTLNSFHAFSRNLQTAGTNIYTGSDVTAFVSRNNDYSLTVSSTTTHDASGDVDFDGAIVGFNKSSNFYTSNQKQSGYGTMQSGGATLGFLADGKQFQGGTGTYTASLNGSFGDGGTDVTTSYSDVQMGQFNGQFTSSSSRVSGSGGGTSNSSQDYLGSFANLIQVTQHDTDTTHTSFGTLSHQGMTLGKRSQDQDNTETTAVSTNLNGVKTTASSFSHASSFEKSNFDTITIGSGILLDGKVDYTFTSISKEKGDFGSNSDGNFSTKVDKSVGQTSDIDKSWGSSESNRSGDFSSQENEVIHTMMSGAVETDTTSEYSDQGTFDWKSDQHSLHDISAAASTTTSTSQTGADFKDKGDGTFANEYQKHVATGPSTKISTEHSLSTTDSKGKSESKRWSNSDFQEQAPQIYEARQSDSLAEDKTEYEGQNSSERWIDNGVTTGVDHADSNSSTDGTHSSKTAHLVDRTTTTAAGSGTVTVTIKSNATAEITGKTTSTAESSYDGQIYGDGSKSSLATTSVTSAATGTSSSKNDLDYYDDKTDVPNIHRMSTLITKSSSSGTSSDNSHRETVNATFVNGTSMSSVIESGDGKSHTDSSSTNDSWYDVVDKTRSDVIVHVENFSYTVETGVKADTKYDYYSQSGSGPGAPPTIAWNNDKTTGSGDMSIDESKTTAITEANNSNNWQKDETTYKSNPGAGSYTYDATNKYNRYADGTTSNYSASNRVENDKYDATHITTTNKDETDANSKAGVPAHTTGGSTDSTIQKGVSRKEEYHYVVAQDASGTIKSSETRYHEDSGKSDLSYSSDSQITLDGTTSNGTKIDVTSTNSFSNTGYENFEHKNRTTTDRQGQKYLVTTYTYSHENGNLDYDTSSSRTGDQKRLNYTNPEGLTASDTVTFNDSSSGFGKETWNNTTDLTSNGKGSKEGTVSTISHVDDTLFWNKSTVASKTASGNCGIVIEDGIHKLTVITHRDITADSEKTDDGDSFDSADLNVTVTYSFTDDPVYSGPSNGDPEGKSTANSHRTRVEITETTKTDEWSSTPRNITPAPPPTKSDHTKVLNLSTTTEITVNGSAQLEIQSDGTKVWSGGTLVDTKTGVEKHEENTVAQPTAISLTKQKGNNDRWETYTITESSGTVTDLEKRTRTSDYSSLKADGSYGGTIGNYQLNPTDEVEFIHQNSYAHNNTKTETWDEIDLSQFGKITLDHWEETRSSLNVGTGSPSDETYTSTKHADGSIDKVWSQTGFGDHSKSVHTKITSGYIPSTMTTQSTERQSTESKSTLTTGVKLHIAPDGTTTVNNDISDRTSWNKTEDYLFRSSHPTSFTSSNNPWLISLKSGQIGFDAGTVDSKFENDHLEYDRTFTESTNHQERIPSTNPNQADIKIHQTATHDHTYSYYDKNKVALNNVSLVRSSDQSTLTMSLEGDHNESLDAAYHWETEFDLTITQTKYAPSLQYPLGLTTNGVAWQTAKAAENWSYLAKSNLLSKTTQDAKAHIVQYEAGPPVQGSKIPTWISKDFNTSATNTGNYLLDYSDSQTYDLLTQTVPFNVPTATPQNDGKITGTGADNPLEFWNGPDTILNGKAMQFPMFQLAVSSPNQGAATLATWLDENRTPGMKAVSNRENFNSDIYQIDAGPTGAAEQEIETRRNLEEAERNRREASAWWAGLWANSAGYFTGDASWYTWAGDGLYAYQNTMGQVFDAIAGGIDGFFDTINPFDAFASMPNVGAAFGNLDYYNTGYATGAVAGVAATIVVSAYGPGLVQCGSIGAKVMTAWEVVDGIAAVATAAKNYQEGNFGVMDAIGLIGGGISIGSLKNMNCFTADMFFVAGPTAPSFVMSTDDHVDYAEFIWLAAAAGTFVGFVAMCRKPPEEKRREQFAMPELLLKPVPNGVTFAGAGPWPDEGQIAGLTETTSQRRGDGSLEVIPATLTHDFGSRRGRQSSSKKPVVPRWLMAFGLLLVSSFCGWQAFQTHTDRNTAAALDTAAPTTGSPWQMKRVNEFKPGDTILAYNHETGQTELRKVVRTFERTSHHLRLLDVRSEDGQTQRVETTDEHPFWLPESNEYVLADKLKSGNEFLSPSGTLLIVIATNREEHPEGVSVYNLEVNGDHNYFVTAGPNAEPMLAHNDCGPPVLKDSKGRWHDVDGKFTSAPSTPHVVLGKDRNYREMAEAMHAEHFAINPDRYKANKTVAKALNRKFIDRVASQKKTIKFSDNAWDHYGQDSGFGRELNRLVEKWGYEIIDNGWTAIPPP